MKKKIFISIAIGLFAVVTVINMNLMRSNNADDISLENIAIMAMASSDETDDTCRGGSWQYVIAQGEMWDCDGNDKVFYHAVGGFEYCTTTGAIRNDNSRWKETDREIGGC